VIKKPSYPSSGNPAIHENCKSWLPFHAIGGLLDLYLFIFEGEMEYPPAEELLSAFQIGVAIITERFNGLLIGPTRTYMEDKEAGKWD
jgi:hypothetical protein